MKSTLVWLISKTKLSARPSMVDPFLATVSGFMPQSPPSAITTIFPTVGLAGSVTVKEPPVVFAIIPSSVVAV